MEPLREVKDVRPGHPLWGRASWRRNMLPEDTPAFAELFARKALLEVEIGCGRGDFLSARALRLPERNFLGVETQPNRARVSSRKSAEGQTNFRILNTDARLIFGGYLPAGSVAAVHVYFPDPWPKKRHFKRRLLNAEFFKSVNTVLAPEAVLYLATDYQPYYDFIREELEASGTGWKIVRETVNERICDPDLKTEFEMRFEADKRPRYYLEIHK